MASPARCEQWSIRQLENILFLVEPRTNRLARTSMSEPVSYASKDEPGVALEKVHELRLSESVKGVLELCRTLARDNHFGGLYGTGLMLVALYESGKQYHQGHVLFELTKLTDAGGREGFARARAAFFERERAGANTSALEVPRISQPLFDVFLEAKKLPAWDNVLASRHLIVALLNHSGSSSGASNAWRLLDEAGVDRSVLLRAIAAWVAQSAHAKERRYWQELAGIAATKPEKRPGPRLPGFGADVPSGRAADDCLDLHATVSAMANLIASPELEGNLSLGVFGNWGSGKSFFMRRLQGAIAELSEQARVERKRDAQALPPYWPNIVQVEFNAWHYADANLWASLVSHLLEQLQRFRPDGLAQKSSLDEALAQLSLAAAARNEAIRVQTVAANAREGAKTALATAQTDVTDATRRLTEAATSSLWVTVEEKVKGTEVATALATARKEMGSAEQAAKDTVTAVQPLYDEIRDLTSTSGRLRELVLQLLHAPAGGRVVLQVAAVVLIPALALLVVLVSRPEWATASTSVVASVTAATAAFTRAALWLRTQAGQVFAAIEPLTKMRAKIEAALSEAEKDKAARIAILQQELAVKSAALDSAQREATVSEAQVQAAAAAVTAIVTGSSIGRFIEQRLASSDYQKQLGLVAVIRRDFEQLSQLILGHNARRRQPQEEVERIRKQVIAALPDAKPEQVNAMFDNLGVNRIVIYIDDLDRCPPDRVVDVLQAIHLLLAFPVFVVVVGVDARWMAHSLSEQYPAMLGATKSSEAGAPQASVFAAVSPSDYLEKIFQIPFWVPPLDADATRSLLSKIAGPKPAPEPPEPPPKPPVAEPPPKREHTQSAPPVIISSGPGAGSRLTPGAPPDNPHLEEPGPSVALLRPEVLQLNDDELTAMGELARVIGRSPRAATRFVNSYRLLKAALSERDREKLGVSDSGLGGLAAPMLMLAVITGAPMLASNFLAPRPSAAATPFEYLNALAQAPPTSVDVFDTFERLRLFCKECTGKEKGGWTSLRFDDLSPWSTRVAQFAFEDLATVNAVVAE
jgi:hypothetical protein